MASSSRLPIFSTAAAAIENAVRSVLPFAKIYWLAWLGATLVLLVLALFMAAHWPPGTLPPWLAMLVSPVTGGPSRWLTQLVWAPFTAYVAIRTIQFVNSRRVVGWRPTGGLPQGLAAVAVICAVWGLIELAIQYVVGYSSRAVIMHWYGVEAFHHVTALQWIGLASLIVTLLLKAVVTAFAGQAIWLISVFGSLDREQYWRSIRSGGWRLIAYFMLFGIALNQLQVYYYWAASSLIGWPSSTGASVPWRDQVVPRAIESAYELPLDFTYTLIWIMSVAQVFAHLIHAPAVTDIQADA